MNRLIVFTITATLFFVIANFSGVNVSISSQCLNNECIVSVSSSLLSILFGVLFAAFILFFKQIKHELDNEGTVGIWRRFGAFIVDYAAILVALMPILTLPILIAEANYTGVFQWSFYRDFARDTDNLFILPTILSIFICLFLYFCIFTNTPP